MKVVCSLDASDAGFLSFFVDAISNGMAITYLTLYRLLCHLGALTKVMFFSSKQTHSS